MKVFQSKAIATSIDEKNYTLKAVMTAEVVDRHGDIVDVETMSVENFLLNPVCLQFHNYYEMAVGKVVDITKTEVNGVKTLECTIKFAVEEYDVAKTMFDLYKGGYMSAFSIGFRVGDVEMEADTGTTKLLSCELLEISCVAVPANQLALAKSKGIDTDAYLKSSPVTLVKEMLLDIKSVLDTLSSEPEQVPDEVKAEETPELDVEKDTAILKQAEAKRASRILGKAIRGLR